MTVLSDAVAAAQAAQANLQTAANAVSAYISSGAAATALAASEADAATAATNLGTLTEGLTTIASQLTALTVTPAA